MNTSRLRETIEKLLQAEILSSFQSLLSDVNNHLSTLANQPSSPPHQTNFANALQQLREAYQRMQKRFEPAELKRFEEIHAGPYFVDDIPRDISTKVAENPATPAVAQQYVADLLTRRQNFLNTLVEVGERLDRLGVASSKLTEGESEIGFTIPRKLFDDNLDGLLVELREIRRIIRAFSEAATGTVEPIVVRQISTTDPLFLFGISVATIIMIGNTVHWILDTWKKVEDIREVRESTRRLELEGEKILLDMFDTKIKNTIDAAIDAKVKQLTPQTDAKDGRVRELETSLKHALDSLFARIERGMTVEIRFLPPSSSAEPSEDNSDTISADVFSQLAQISPKLVFPPPATDPILSLPRSQGPASN